MKRTKTNYRRCTRDIPPCSMLSRCNVTASPLFFSFFFFLLFSFPLLTRRWSTFAWEKAKCHPLIEDRKSSLDVARDFVMDCMILVVKFFTKCIRKKNLKVIYIYIYLNFKICNFLKEKIIWQINILFFFSSI